MLNTRMQISLVKRSNATMFNIKIGSVPGPIVESLIWTERIEFSTGSSGRSFWEARWTWRDRAGLVDQVEQRWYSIITRYIHMTIHNNIIISWYLYFDQVKRTPCSQELPVCGEKKHHKETILKLVSQITISTIIVSQIIIFRNIVSQIVTSTIICVLYCCLFDWLNCCIKHTFQSQYLLQVRVLSRSILLFCLLIFPV